MFNKKWMENINQDLLIRFWREKGSRESLIIKKNGAYFEHRNYNGIEIQSIIHSVFLNSEKETK